MSDFQRARQPEQKEERRRQLLRTAEAMLDEGLGLDALSLNELARRAGMTKSNVYRYFESREAVLLALLVEEWRAWATALVEGWRRPAAGDPLDALVAHLAGSLAERPRLCRLTAALPSVLEQNLSPAAVLAFKRETLGFFEGLAGWLSAEAPALSPAAAFSLLHDGVALVVGLTPLCQPCPAVEAALQEPGLAPLRRELGRDLGRMLGALARAARG